MGRALDRNPKPKNTEAAGAPGPLLRLGGREGCPAPARDESAQGRPGGARREREEVVDTRSPVPGGPADQPGGLQDREDLVPLPHLALPVSCTLRFCV